MTRRTLAAAAAVLASLALAAPAGAIVGGHAPSRPYPAMAALLLDGKLECGSSLVAPDMILTAAHCVAGTEASRLSVAIGSTDYQSAEAERIDVAEVTVPQEYSGSSFDIGLLRLKSASTHAPLRIVSPAERDRWAAGQQATVIGWGADGFLIGSPSSQLREVQVPIVDDRTCMNSYPTDWDAGTMLCAGNQLGGADSCQGDSGGPLMVPDRNNQMMLVGTVSFGNGCGFPFEYGVYGRVGDTLMHDWLVAHLPASATGAPAAPAPLAGTLVAAPRVRIVAARALGTLASARRHHEVRLVLRSSGPLSGVRVKLLAAGKAVARAAITRLVGQDVVALRLPKAAGGTLRISVRGHDGSGHRVVYAGKLRFSK